MRATSFLGVVMIMVTMEGSRCHAEKDTGDVGKETLNAMVTDKKSVSTETLNTMVVRTMQQQLKTMEYNLKLIQLACEKKSSSPAQQREKIVAFHARLREEIQSARSIEKIKFNDVLLNEGNAYNGQTGEFTCLQDGVYVFQWTISTDPGKKFDVELMVGSKLVATTFNRQPEKQSSSVSSSLVVKLKEGDIVYLKPRSKYEEHAYSFYARFSGFKL